MVQIVHINGLHTLETFEVHKFTNLGEILRRPSLGVREENSNLAKSLYVLEARAV